MQKLFRSLSTVFVSLFLFSGVSFAQTIPTISATPNPGTYTTALPVTFSYPSDPNYDDILYTTDGSNPFCADIDPMGVITPQHGTAHASPVQLNVSLTATINARICSVYQDQTEIQSFTYTINQPQQNAPVSAITLPAGDISVAPSTPVNITATATPNNPGTKMEFSVNGTIFSTDPQAPFQAVWPGAQIGTFTITALAVNSSGIYSQSTQANTVTIDIGTGTVFSPPSYTFTIPGQGTNTNNGNNNQNGNTFSLNNLFSGLGVSLPSNCVNSQSEQSANQSGENWYCFLAPLIPTEPEINTSASANDTTPIIPKVVNMFFKVGIAILIVLAVLMFAYNAFQYMLSPSVFDKKSATTGMWHAILGLVLGLSIYLILSIINTNLLNLDIDISQNNINILAQDSIANELLTADQFTAITGSAPKSSAEIDAIITSVVATKFPSPATDADREKHACAIKSIIQKESGFQSGAIGHDEDVGLPNSPATKSARALIASARKYSSDTAFTTNPPKNDDAGHSGTPVENAPGLGLDWRFTHGIGLMQVTFFPTAWGNANYETNPPAWNTRNTLPPLIENRNPKEMLVEQNNIESGTQIYKGMYTTCQNNSSSTNIWLKTFSAYNRGNAGCGIQGGTPYGQAVYATFQACVAAL